MRIRTRLTLWFAAVLMSALAAMVALSYREFVVEARHQSRSDQATGEEGDENGMADLAEIGLWCGMPAMALALGGGWWLVRQALTPVAALTAAAERLNEHNLGARLKPSGNGDELDRLTEVFNGMTERLNSAFARLREFTLHASHELKTPLTVMHAELEDWLRDEDLTAQQRKRVESEMAEVQRLTKIVDGLTLLTKAGAGQVTLSREAVRLDELVREALADAESLARPGGIEVKLAGCDEATVNGDRHRLRQLLLNLCDNAVKYNEHGGQVTLELKRRAGAAEINITNTGAGIPPEVLPRVFDPFFRGDASHSQAVEGCGLGLSIARWIATAHGGTLEISSEPNRFTTAMVRLPVLVNAKG